MFCIHHVHHKNHDLITLSGSLTLDNEAAIEAGCCGAVATSRRATIFLNKIKSIDPAGRALLHRFVVMGIDLRGIGIYERYLVRMARRPTARTADVQRTNRRELRVAANGGILKFPGA